MQYFLLLVINNVTSFNIMSQKNSTFALINKNKLNIIKFFKYKTDINNFKIKTIIG